METKLFEVRDAGTFIPVVAIKCQSEFVESEQWLLGRAGYARTSDCIFVGKLATGGGEYDPYKWGNSRTMRAAHTHIVKNWDTLKSGDVVCVEHIIGERATPKTSERFDE